MRTILLALLLTRTLPLVAQSEIRWPADTAWAQEKVALYSDALRNQDYAAGRQPLRWLLQEAPDLSKSLYIKGEKLYRGLIDRTTDPTLRQQYQAEALQLYDLRRKHFGEATKVLNRQAHAAYRFYRTNAAQYDTLLVLFEQLLAEGPAQVSSSNLLAYMDVLRLAGDSLSDEAVLRRYDQISEQLRKRGEAEKQAMVDKMLTATVALDCRIIGDKFGSAFRQDTTDLSRAKKVVALALAYDCAELPELLPAWRSIQRQQPSAKLAIRLARRHEQQGDRSRAEAYYQAALNLAGHESLRAPLAYQLAEYYQRTNQKAAARTAARQALQLDSHYREAYRLIGDLYFDSYQTCRQGEQRSADRAVYWAAYEMYRRAGRKDLMQQAAQQFPTAEHVFIEGYEEGQEIRIGCWINETVRVR